MKKYVDDKWVITNFNEYNSEEQKVISQLVYDLTQFNFICGPGESNEIWVKYINGNIVNIVKGDSNLNYARNAVLNNSKSSHFMSLIKELFKAGKNKRALAKLYDDEKFMKLIMLIQSDFTKAIGVRTISSLKGKLKTTNDDDAKEKKDEFYRNFKKLEDDYAKKELLDYLKGWGILILIALLAGLARGC
tara:strand:+ start:302 stop:871 length:570 start_codon:yes stop_codon:yes gene_type:complete